MNYKVLVASLCSVIFLSACSERGSGSFLTVLDEPLQSIPGLVLPTILNPGVDNCSADAFSLPGQAHFRGSEGGLTEAISGTAFESSNATNPQAEGQMVSSLPHYPPSQSTALLVVDHFGNGLYELPEELYEMSTEEAAELQKSDKFFHGTLVFHHTNALIEGTGLYTYSQKSTADTAVWITNKGIELRVVAVNTDAAPSSHIASQIQNTLSLLRGQGIMHTAINMSFVLLPCDLIEDFVLSKWTTFEDYVTALAEDQGIPKHQVESFIRRLVETSNQSSDPLYTLISDNTPNAYSAKDHVYVASSGNFAKPYPMYPAAWGKVVSVSGSSVINPEQREMSMFNTGEVMTIGAVFKLTDISDQAQSKLYYAGTSFSAPAVSLFSALDLASKQSRCLDGQDASLLAHNNPNSMDVHLRELVPYYCH